MSFDITGQFSQFSLRFYNNLESKIRKSLQKSQNINFKSQQSIHTPTRSQKIVHKKKNQTFCSKNANKSEKFCVLNLNLF